MCWVLIFFNNSNNEKAEELLKKASFCERNSIRCFSLKGYQECLRWCWATYKAALATRSSSGLFRFSFLFFKYRLSSLQGLSLFSSFYFCFVSTIQMLAENSPTHICFLCYNLVCLSLTKNANWLSNGLMFQPLSSIHVAACVGL